MDRGFSLGPEIVIVMIVMRCGLAASGTAMVGRGVRTVRSGGATAGAAPSAATGTVVRRVLTGTGLTHTPAAQQGHLGEDLQRQRNLF